MTSDKTLLKRWPDHLVNRVKARNFVLVVGAGISQHCANRGGQRPPSWSALLEDLAARFTEGATKAAVRQLIERRQYLDAAEILRSKARSQSKEQDFVNRIADVTDGGTKPDLQYQPSVLHTTLLRLEPDVLLTTNFDRILERASKNGFNVHPYGSSSLASDVRSGIPVLVKVHGSVDNPRDVILTRTDYTRLRRQGETAFEVLQALFLTRTALFVGYGFNDPDIQLILENVLGGRGDVPAHYLLTMGVVPQYQRDMYATSYGTAVVTFAKDNFDEMERMLELLSEQVEGTR